jgi:hemolysin activation/secretion protein
MLRLLTYFYHSLRCWQHYFYLFAISAFISMPSLSMGANNLPEPGYLPRPDPNQTFPRSYAPALIKPSDNNAKQASQNEVLIQVNQFVFDGNDSISSAELNTIAQPYRNQALSIQQLNKLTQQLTEYYQSKGFLLAQAYLPEQEINGNSLTIAIIEGRLDTLKLQASPSLNAQFFENMATNQQTFKQGSLVTDLNFVKQLSIINALPGVKASASLNPGTWVGSTSVNIDVEAEPRWGGFINANTFGNRFTSREVLNAGVFINNLAGRGDQLLTQLTDSRNERQKSLRLSYQLPVHYSGTLLSLNLSHLEYRLGREFSRLGANGDSQLFALSLDQPIIRNRNQSLNLRVSASNKQIEDNVSAFRLSNDRKINALDLSLYGDWQDQQLKSTNQLGLSIRSGHLDFKNALSKNLDVTGANTDGSFSKLNLTANRTQYFSDTLSLSINAEYQIADKNLDSVEKIAIGGINRWRAFAELPTAADQGGILGLELRQRYNNVNFQEIALNSLSPYVFIDYGKGKLNQKALAPNNTVHSAHYGVGVDTTFAKQWSLGLVTSYQSRKVHQTIDESETRLWGQLQFTF